MKMRQYFLMSLFLLTLSVASGQQFRLIGNPTTGFTTVNDSTYTASFSFPADQTGNNFLPTQIPTNGTYRMFFQNSRVYKITGVANATFSDADLTLVEYGSSDGAPSGQGLVYNPSGRETVPQAPANATGASPLLNSVIATYNIQFTGGGIVNEVDPLYTADSDNIARRSELYTVLDTTINSDGTDFNALILETLFDSYQEIRIDAQLEVGAGSDFIISLVNADSVRQKKMFISGVDNSSTYNIIVSGIQGNPSYQLETGESIYLQSQIIDREYKWVFLNKSRTDTEIRNIVSDSIKAFPTLSSFVNTTKTYSVGDRIHIEDTGAEYLIKTDSVAGYETDNVFVIQNGTNYAVYSKNNIDIYTYPVSSVFDYASVTGKTVNISEIINLSGQNIDVGSTTLNFSKGGRIIADTLSATGAKIIAGRHQIFDDELVVNVNSSFDVENGYIEWTSGDLQDSVANFLGLTNCIAMEVTTLLPQDTVVVQTGINKTSTAFNSKLKPIKIQGVAESSVLVIDGTALHSSIAIFEPADFEIRDVMITNKPFIEGDTLSGGFTLIGGAYQPFYNPDYKSSIKLGIVDNVTTKGRVRILASSLNDDNLNTLELYESNANKGLRLIVTNSIFEEGESIPFTLGNSMYGSVLFKNCRFKNQKESFSSFSSGIGDVLPECIDLIKYNSGTVRIENCYYERTYPSSENIATVTIRGGVGNFFFIDNIVKDLTSTANVADTWYYAGSGSATIRGNQFLNVIANPANNEQKLFRNRNVRKLIVDNNSFIVTRQGLVNTGLIDSVNQDLSGIDSTFIALCYAGTAQADKEYVITNNIFQAPYLSGAMEIRDAKSISFTNNIINLEYWLDGPSNSVTEPWSIFFDYSWSVPTEQKQGRSIIFKDNTWEIDTINNPELIFIWNEFGTQSDSSRYDYSVFSVEDDFYINKTILNFEVPNTRHLKISSNIYGDSSSYSLTENLSVNTKRPSAKRSDINVNISDFFQNLDSASRSIKNNPSLLNFTEKSYQKVNVSGNNQSEVLLFDNLTTDWRLYNMTRQNTGFHIRVNYRSETGQRKTTSFFVVHGLPYSNSSIYADNMNDSDFGTNNVSVTQTAQTMRVKPLGYSDIELWIRGGDGVYLEGMEGVQDFSVEIHSFPIEDLTLTGVDVDDVEKLNKYVEVGNYIIPSNTEIYGFDYQYSNQNSLKYILEELKPVVKDIVEIASDTIRSIGPHNLLYKSSNISHFPTWSKLGMVLNPGQTDPQGGSTASEIYYTGGGLGYFAYDGDFGTALNPFWKANQNYNISFWAKNKNENQRGWVIPRVIGSTISSNLDTLHLKDDWKRYNVSFTTDSIAPSDLSGGPFFYTPTTNDTILFAFPQLVEGKYVKDYVATPAGSRVDPVSKIIYIGDIEITGDYLGVVNPTGGTNTVQDAQNDIYQATQIITKSTANADSTFTAIFTGTYSTEAIISVAATTDSVTATLPPPSAALEGYKIKLFSFIASTNIVTYEILSGQFWSSGVNSTSFQVATDGRIDNLTCIYDPQSASYVWSVESN